VLILGAGGSAVALAWHLSKPDYGPTRPSRIHVANRSTPRLTHLEEVHASWRTPVPLTSHHVLRPQDADAILAQLAPGSLVVNATGLGKDAPGSPLTDAAVFPEHGLTWDFNYRGDLHFLVQARRQAAARHLHVEDGWVYFLHGWTRVMAEVFHVEIPARGPGFDALGRIAASTRT
jgi:shikimate 5-dehydrogenase